MAIAALSIWAYAKDRRIEMGTNHQQKRSPYYVRCPVQSTDQGCSQFLLRSRKSRQGNVEDTLEG
jgi:hypothetical protein